MKKLPLIVIVGPTASGKTALAIKLAKQFNGEIICADSRTVYKHLDIGTAKPTKAEQKLVPHWGLDLVEPSEKFTAADFKVYADKKITEIKERGRVPFLVGGTGLYIDSVIFDYSFGSPADPELRNLLEDMTIDQLYEYCVKYNITLPNNYKNKRYVIRAIEQKSITTKRRTNIKPNTLVVGITTEISILRDRIKQRCEQLFKDNVVREATILGKKYGWDNEAMTGNIYPLIRRYLLGEITIDEAKEKFTTLDWRLAKRQLTWFKRNTAIKWGSPQDIEGYVTSRLVTD